MARPASLQRYIDKLSAIHEPDLPICPDWGDCEGRKDYVRRVASAAADWAAAEASEARSHGVHIIARHVREIVFEAITDELCAAYSDLGDSFEERAAAIGLRAAAKSYDTAAQFPDRYSSFHVSVAHNPSNVVGIFRFHHINRRHALSPDGWASLMTTRLVHVDSSDLWRANRANPEAA